MCVASPDSRFACFADTEKCLQIRVAESEVSMQLSLRIGLPGALPAASFGGLAVPTETQSARARSVGLRFYMFRVCKRHLFSVKIVLTRSTYGNSCLSVQYHTLSLFRGSLEIALNSRMCVSSRRGAHFTKTEEVAGSEVITHVLENERLASTREYFCIFKVVIGA